MHAAAVVYVADLDRMSRFYERCFGLVVADRADGYCSLQSEVWILTLLASAESVRSAPGRKPAPRRSQNPIKLAFAVGSIAAVRTLAAGLGGQIDPTSSEWSWQGGTRCDGVDPEGNVVQLVEGGTG